MLLIYKAFTLSKEESKNVLMITPSGKDYNIHLKDNQRIELSKSGKMCYLMEDNYRLKSFNVSKTVFGLKGEK